MHDSFFWETSVISDTTLYAWQRWVSVSHMHAPDRRCTTCNCFLRMTRAQLVTVCDPCRETRDKKRVSANPYKRRKPGRMRDAQEITEGTVRNFWRCCQNGTHQQCWGWTGNLTAQGAPIFSYGGRVISARRVSWQIHIGEMTDNRKLFSGCRRPDCVNPAHLFSVHDKNRRKTNVKN